MSNELINSGLDIINSVFENEYAQMMDWRVYKSSIKDLLSHVDSKLSKYNVDMEDLTSSMSDEEICAFKVYCWLPTVTITDRKEAYKFIKSVMDNNANINVIYDASISPNVNRYNYFKNGLYSPMVPELKTITFYNGMPYHCMITETKDIIFFESSKMTLKEDIHNDKWWFA